MTPRHGMSGRTRLNWLIDATVFMTGLAAGVTGIYFLFFPVGCYQGGGNAAYGLTLVFSRGTWDDLHIWGGVFMIAAGAVHFAFHWPWVVMMVKRLWLPGAHMSRGAKINAAVDGVIGTSFLSTAASGVYLLLTSPGAGQGSLALRWGQAFLLTRAQWDLVHTWAAVLLTGAAALHFIIHWRWIEKVTRRFFRIQKGAGDGARAVVRAAAARRTGV